MATALESEGKIMASAEDLCGLCEDHMAIKHCAVCPVDLCVSCAKGHQKLPTTKDHQLTDILPGNAASKSSKTSTRQGICPKHEDNQFTILCKDCVELGCDSCKTDHSGHSIEALDNDPKLCHRVASKNIQHLLDDVHELEEIKSLLEGQICAYDEATVRVDQWEIDLLKLVQEKAAQLRKQLKDLKDQTIKQLSDQVNGLMGKLKDMDQSITQLTAIRKSMDFQIISKELSKSQNLIKNLESYKNELGPLPVPISVSDVLPNGDKIRIIDGDLDFIFTVGDIRTQSKGPIPVAEWCFTAANGGKDLSIHGKNHVTMTNVTYGPGPRGEPQGAVVVEELGNYVMVVMDPDNKLRFNREMTFFAHVHLSGTGNGPIAIYVKSVNSTEIAGSGSYVWIRGSKTALQIYSDKHFNTPNRFTPNTWQKIAVVIKPTIVSVYIEAQLVHTEHIALDLSYTHNRQLYFGRRPGQTGFEGRIASCKFFDVALNENEIKKL